MKSKSSLCLAVLLAGCGGVENRQATDREHNTIVEGAGEQQSLKASEDIVAVDESGETFALADDIDQTLEVQLDEALVDGVDSLSEQGLEDGQDGSLLIKRSGLRMGERNCQEVGDTAVVTIDRSVERSRSRAGDDREASRSYERSFKATRTWSTEDEAVHCNQWKTAAAFPMTREFYDGLTLQAEFTRVRQASGSYANSEKGIEKSYDAIVTSQGSRRWSLSIEEAESSDELLTVTHTVSIDVKREAKISFADGTEKTRERAVMTMAEQPLVYRAKRDGLRRPLEIELVSGSVATQRPNGTVIETTFANVKLTRGKGLCKASSGQITGAVYKDNAPDPIKTFVVNLDADQATITYDDGTEKSFSPLFCE